MHQSFLILHNIRSVHNVGSVFRTADAAGVQKIFLSGYTPGPLDRFGMPRKDFVKASLGAEHTVPYERVSSLLKLFANLRHEGIEIVALEQSSKSVSYNSVHPKKFALLLGNEVRGIDSRTLKQVDTVVEIPMRGKKESLNVSVACGIALFRIMNI